MARHTGPVPAAPYYDPAYFELEREAFYAAARELLKPALAYLDSEPLPDHDARDRTLMQLVLSLAHVALAVETQQQDEPRHMVHRRELRITRTPADVRD